jgi:NAD(P)-dependent dehydrogenase (short-subunit alcohol dehydrogenase family)
MEQLLKQIRATNVTKTVHEKAYSAISPAKPELSQAGRTVLITGAGGTLGVAIGRAFIQAKAAILILVGRRAEVLESAISKLKQDADAAGTKLIARTCDMGDVDDVKKLWDNLRSEDITLDVFVNNAASFSDETSLMDLGPEKVWSHFDTNVKGPLFFTDQFCKQSTAGQKVSKRTFLPRIES